MLGRPNLVRHHCQEFRILFNLDLSEEFSVPALQGSYNYEDARGRPTAVYGKTYKARQQSHVVDGVVIKMEDGSHSFGFHFQQADRGRPPTDIKSPDLLWTLVMNAAPVQHVDTSFSGSYRFEPADDWDSYLVLPHEFEEPLTFPRLNAFTHLTGARLCNFEGGSIKDTVEVMTEPDGEITLEVNLRRNMTIDARLVKVLFREGNRTSLSLVTKREAASNDDC